MSHHTLGLLLIGVGVVCVLVISVCRTIIVRHAAKAGVPRSWWIERVDFPGRTKVVSILAIALIVGLASFVGGAFYAAKARHAAQTHAAQTHAASHR